MGKRGSRVKHRRSGPRRLIVIGASMGGVEALRALFSRLPAGVEAAFVVVLHRSMGVTVLPEIITRESGQPAEEARDGVELRPCGIYVAPAGMHTRIEGSRLRVELGPRENGHRPSIDVLFRSAADSFGDRVIGVVLSGALDCGANGLLEIKRRGGVAIVQDPKTALNPQMPKSALDLVQADYVVPPMAMGRLFARLVTRRPRARKGTAAPQREELSSFVCPECNGPIWQTGGRSYRCRVGHRFSSEQFFAHKEKRLESALWEALNVMQERVDLSHRMAARARENGHRDIAERYESRAGDTAETAAMLRELVYRAGGVLPVDDEPNGRRRPRKAQRRRKRSV